MQFRLTGNFCYFWVMEDDPVRQIFLRKKAFNKWSEFVFLSTFTFGPEFDPILPQNRRCDR